MSDELTPMGYHNAGEARARGEVVPDDVPDCAMAWCYGWDIDVSSDERGSLKATMTARRPHWRWVTANITVSR